jgi:hypothetical protein
MAVIHVFRLIQSGFQVIRFLNARDHTILDHLNTGLVRYLDPRCIVWFNGQMYALCHASLQYNP